jgi:hypothetical protein
MYLRKMLRPYVDSERRKAWGAWDILSHPLPANEAMLDDPDVRQQTVRFGLAFYPIAFVAASLLSDLIASKPARRRLAEDAGFLDMMACYVVCLPLMSI